MKRSNKKQHGQATTEWTVATFAMIVALFIPWNGQQSAVSLFMDAVRTHHANSSYTLSLP